VSIILLCALLLGSLSLNVQQYQLANRQRLQALAAEQTAVTKANQAKLEAEQKKLKKARQAKNDERLQKLYQELDNLTRIHEQVQIPKQKTSRSTPAKTDDLERAVESR
jgi:flagellar basal body P-ring protein FlgI